MTAIAPDAPAAACDSSPSRSATAAEGPSPGQVFAARLSSLRPSDGPVTVHFEGHLPAAFPLFATRSRYTVRHLLNIQDGSNASGLPYVFEHTTTNSRKAGTSYLSSPEASFAAQLEESTTTDLEVEVELPEGILEYPDVLANFIDMRVLVRLSVVENQSLLHGSTDGVIPGLLSFPGVRYRQVDQIDEAALVANAAAVEEMGGSCDGVVIHPNIYWQLVSSGGMQRLGAAGVTISRTRMMPESSALIGDFRAAGTLNLPGVASITLIPSNHRDRVRARTRVGLNIHLPQHLMHLEVTRKGGAL